MAFEANYEASLKHVTSIGKWSKDNKNGHLRFITNTVGSENIITTLHFQWLTYHEDGFDKSEIFDEKEIIDKIKKEDRKYEFLAGRLEAKEALYKEHGSGIGKLKCTDIRIN
mgnify:CR=1 FL=1